ncbi:hypothetical protein HPA02_06360 [Bisbaumannia pacifica]|uniref:Uncharacterized protein n=1 Tax=Bisbaumannia pacifica TaxID=77098 RepID=A0A510X4M0_9GAMM|nr:hypothetical protein HPA02_06360 [Halomonas pacifica]
MSWLAAMALLLSVAGCGGEAEPPASSSTAGGGEGAAPRATDARDPAEPVAVLDEPIRVSLSALPRDDRRLDVSGATNLPEGSRLQLVVIREASGVSWRQRLQVGEDGNFEAGPLGPGSGLAAGRYTLQLSMSPASVQPPEVRALIGERGEHLSGDWVRESGHGLGRVIEYQVPYELSHR